MFLFTRPTRTAPPDDGRKQNSIKSLILYHIGDYFSIVASSDSWESFFNRVVPEQYHYPSLYGNEHRGKLFSDSLLDKLTMLSVFNDLPLSNRLDILAVTIIDNYLVEMYQNAMNWSHYYDKESKVWGRGTISLKKFIFHLYLSTIFCQSTCRAIVYLSCPPSLLILILLMG